MSTSPYSRQKHEMRNLIFAQHSQIGAPATYRRNGSGGIVDGIWGTPMVDVTKSGFLESGDFPGDHTALWVDVIFESVLGHDPPVPDVFSARRLQLIDSKATQKYLRIYENLVQRSGLAERVRALEAQIVPGQRLSAAQRRTAERLDEERTRYMNKAEKKCRKLRMGAVEFSAATDVPRKHFEFWAIAISRRKGCKVSGRLWRRKKHMAGIKEVVKDLTDEQMEERLQDAKSSIVQQRKKHQQRD